MILVDIYVPLMERTYDFRVDETAKIDILVAELAEMICQKEHWPRPENAKQIVLCDLDTHQIFPEGATLEGMGVSSGHRLMLL